MRDPLLDRDLGPRAGASRNQAGRHLLGDRVEELVDPAEVVVDQCPGDARGLGDVGGADLGVAALADQLAGCVDDLAAPRPAAADGPVALAALRMVRQMAVAGRGDR